MPASICKGWDLGYELGGCRVVELVEAVVRVEADAEDEAVEIELSAALDNDDDGAGIGSGSSILTGPRCYRRLNRIVSEYVHTRSGNRDRRRE